MMAVWARSGWDSRIDSSRRLSLRSSLIWTIGGNAGYAAAQWGILVLLARTQDAAAVGHFALALAVTAPWFIAASLQLRAVQATDISGRFSFGKFLALRIVAVAIALGSVFLVALTYGAGLWLPIVLMGAAKAVECVSDIVCGVFQSHERLDLVTRSMLLRGLCSLLAAIASVAVAGDVTFLIALLVLARLVVLIGYDLPLCRRYVANTRPDFCWRGITELFNVAWPLGLVSMLGCANVNFPRYEIERSLGAADLGIFSALSSIPVLGAMMVSAVAASAIPRLTFLFSEGAIREFSTLGWKLCGAAAAAGAGFVVVAAAAGRPALTLLYGPLYASRCDVFLLLAVATAIALPTAMVNACINAAHNFRIQVPVILLVSTTTIAASACLVPKCGLIGAAIALICGGALNLALNIAVLFRAFALRSMKQSGLARSGFSTQRT